MAGANEDRGENRFGPRFIDCLHPSATPEANIDLPPTSGCWGAAAWRPPAYLALGISAEMEARSNRENEKAAAIRRRVDKCAVRSNSPGATKGLRRSIHE